MSRTPIRVVALPASASGQVGPQAADQRLNYMGFTVCEKTGAACRIRVRSDGVVTGDVLDTISLAANESSGDEYRHGRPAGLGLYIELVSGAMPEGSVFFS